MEASRRKQQTLPFWLSEATEAEEEALLNRALILVEANLAVCRLVERVAECRGGINGWVEVSYEEMAHSPRWLRGSVSNAYRAVSTAQRLGLVRIRKYDGPTQRNQYSINWDRVREICGLAHQTGPIQGSGDQLHSVGQPDRALGQPDRAWTMGNGDPQGDPSRTRTRATGTTADIPPTAAETVGTVAAADPVEVRAVAIGQVCPQLWKGRPEERAGIAARNDQRLAYQLAVLLCDPDHRPWVSRMLAAARAEARKPAAFVMHSIEDFCPGGRRLMRSIHVPGWAHADPRLWPERSADAEGPP